MNYANETEAGPNPSRGLPIGHRFIELVPDVSTILLPHLLQTLFHSCGMLCPNLVAPELSTLFSTM